MMRTVQSYDGMVYEMKLQKKNWKYMSLKKTYYLMLGGLIGLPILLIISGAFYVLNQQYKEQAIENIKQMQQTVIADMTSDIDEMAMRMTTMIYANDYEVLGYAAGTNTKDGGEKEQNRENLDKVENLYLVPNKEVISMYFMMEDGTATFLKSYIERESMGVEKTQWYQNALEHKDKVYVGSFDTESSGEIFVGGKKDMLVLTAALSPSSTTDRSGKIKMIELYQSSKVADRIKENNKKYLAGKNRLGLSRITDKDGNCLFTTIDEENKKWNSGYLCVKSPIQMYDTVWYIENYIKPSELTAEFRRVGAILLIITLALFGLLAYYSSYFVKSIVKPIGEMNQGLKEVEEGRLDVHIKASGQFEIRSMIHQFNAMVRQLQTFFKEYEDKLKSGRNATFYFREMMAGRMIPAEVEREYEPFFRDSYAILAGYLYDYSADGGEQEQTESLIQEFRKNSRYASRCCSYIENSRVIYLSYRIAEQDYKNGLHQMLSELQRIVARKNGRALFFYEGKRCESSEEFLTEVENVKRGMQVRYLVPEDACVEAEELWKNQGAEILQMAEAMDEIVGPAFLADEKNLNIKREQLFEEMRSYPLRNVQYTALGIIIAAGRRAEQNNDSIVKIFGKQYNYIDKMMQMEEERSIRMWIMNFLNWILDYSASKLDVKENDMIVLAKRYMQDNYDNPELTLNEVAAHVGLNEKYFSNRFTREAGETVSAYLTGIRMQKAKELLKTTNFKVYEIAEMVGYHNVEHFNRVFKKIFEISPTKYRKSE